MVSPWRLPCSPLWVLTAWFKPAYGVSALLGPLLLLVAISLLFSPISVSFHCTLLHLVGFSSVSFCFPSFVCSHVSHKTLVLAIKRAAAYIALPEAAFNFLSSLFFLKEQRKVLTCCGYLCGSHGPSYSHEPSHVCQIPAGVSACCQPGLYAHRGVSMQRHCQLGLGHGTQSANSALCSHGVGCGQSSVGAFQTIS